MIECGSDACVPVPLAGGRAYTIHVGAGNLLRVGALLAATPQIVGRRAIVVTQPAIGRRWAGPLLEGLRDAGFETASPVTFPAGERHKTMGTMGTLYAALYALAPAVDRRTLLIALGGGVVGDMVGFLAATYLRGLDYVQVPTTLLAMVDSSVGGKTGVDFRAGKNLIGAFHQPRAVVIDTETLRTLPARETRSGMAEVIKYGAIHDAGLLAEITSRGLSLQGSKQQAALAPIIARCCAIKAGIVVEDEFEWTGSRAQLNFGHTIGHALESATAYRRFKHGEAVAIGMMAAARIGEEHGITPPDVAPTLASALTAQGLPVHVPADIDPEAVLALLGRDKKALAGVARFVLAERLGSVQLVHDVSPVAVRRGLMRTYAQEMA